MNDLAIRIENLSKVYKIGLVRRRENTLRDEISESVRSFFRRNGRKHQGEDTFWALKNLSFNVMQGEVVGIIGRNGAGKSTLLKILSRITRPTEGRALIYGRVASLLEVGTGFQRELTGRDNIYLNGAILGMKRGEIERKFDEIVDFSGVEQFIDTPVKHYSSGMYVRLAFAVAAHLEPEILIVDEVLAVGDSEFQKKCLGKLGSVAREGRTVLFVSHNLGAVQMLCSTACLLESGNLIFKGEVGSVVSMYLSRSRGRISSLSLAQRTDRSGNGSLRFLKVSFENREGQEFVSAQTGEDLIIVLDYERTTRSEGAAVIRMAFTNMYGQKLFLCLSRCSYAGVLRLPPKGQIKCRIPDLPLLPGRYNVDLRCKVNEELADHVEDAFAIDVDSGDYFGTGKSIPEDGGDLLVNHSWEVL